MNHDEILFVMGHEMGHYKLLHLWKGVAFTFLLSFGLFFVSGKMMAWATARYGPRWRFTRLSDEASLPLFISAISLAALIAQPLSNAFSRRVEHEADTFGLEITHLNDAGARAFIKLASQNRSDPEPSEFVKLMQYSHPPLGDRIRYAIAYHPWTDSLPE
jgi:Zn-dependent protease with chaperone function